MKIFTASCLAGLALVPATALRPADDTVHLKDGSLQKGMVVDLGGNRIEVHRERGSRVILKRDIDHIEFDTEREPRSTESSDGIVRQGGHVVRGKVDLLDGGQKVQVTLPSGGIATFSRKDVQRILRRGDVTEHDTTVYTRELRQRVDNALRQLASGGSEGSAAEKLLASCGVLAISSILEARNKAAAGAPEIPALDRLIRLHRLKEIVASPLEEAEPKIYEVLAGQETREKLDLLALIFPRFLEDSPALAQFLALDEAEDPVVRAWSVDYLRRMRRNRELVRIFLSTGGKTQLVAAMALGQNRILIGVPTLIEALELDLPEVRALAANSLKDITRQDFQFRPDGAPQARKEAVERWRTWWQQNETSLLHAAQVLLQGSDMEGLATAEETSPERALAVSLWKEAGLEVEAKHHALAESLLRQAIDHDPSFLQATLAHAVVLYSHLGRPAEAARLLIEARTKRFAGLRKEERQWLHLHLGNALRLAGDLKGAIESYESCLSVAPENYQALLSLGDASFTRAVGEEDLKPAERKALRDRALAATRGAIQLTDQLLRELTTLRSEQVGENREAGFDRREYNRSILSLRKVYRSSRYQLLFRSARILSLEPQAKEALLVLKGLVADLGLENDPDSRRLEAEVRCFLGLLYEEQQQPLLAWREYRKVLQDLNGEHPDARAGFERVRQHGKETPAPGN